MNSSARDGTTSIWRVMVDEIKRPFPLTLRVLWPMMVLLALIPAYVLVPEYTAQRSQYWPESAFDRLVPVQPAWVVVYGSHLMFVLFPGLVLREEEHIRRTLWAIVSVWTVGIAFFLVFPTVIDRPAPDPQGGFFAWGLRVVYTADHACNCFPSLHVAHAFVTAFACKPIHRGVGLACGVWATLIGISTVLTRQHYIADVVAGALLAWIVSRVFLHGHSPPPTPPGAQRVAPALLVALIGCWGIVVAGFATYYWTLVR